MNAPAGPAPVKVRVRIKRFNPERAELENVKAAIRQGIITPTTRAMLEEAEAKVARLEPALPTLRMRRPAGLLSCPR